MSKEATLVYITAGYAFLLGAVYFRYALSASSRSSSGDEPTVRSDASDHGRIERADDKRERISPNARYAVSAVGFVVGCAVLAHVITPAVAYAFLCLSMAVRCISDQILEERTPRRRSALIRRSRSIEPVLLTWIALTAATPFVLIPWLLEQPYRVAAVMVSVCVLLMVTVAWLIASAPPLLFGNDVEAEQVVDRETRALRTGNACFLTVCAVSVFVAFTGGQQGFIEHRFTVWGLELLCLALLAWRWLYARQVTRTPLTS